MPDSITSIEIAPPPYDTVAHANGGFDLASEDIEPRPPALSESRIRTLTAGQLSQYDEPLEEEKSDWRSIWIANLISLMTGIQYSVFVTSVWPYLQEITNRQASQVFFGYVIAVFALCQGLAAPLLGWWANKSKKARWPLFLGCVFMLVGNAIYCVADVRQIPVEYRQWVVFTARAVMGLGGSVNSVLRAYVATASVKQDRGKAMALTIGLGSAGVTMGPVAFTPLGYPTTWFYGIINMYSAPALASILLMVVCMLLLLFAFNEHYAGIVSDEIKNDKFFVLPRYDLLPVFVCLLCWLCQAVVITNIEAIMTPYTMIMYNWTYSEAISYTGYLILGAGLLSTVGFGVFALTRLSRTDERIGILAGICMFNAFHIITFPWPGFPWKINYQITGLHPSLNATTTTQMSTTETDAVGCPTDYEWCSYTPKVPLALLFTSYCVFVSIGFVPLTAPLSVLFSKVLGPRRQGTMQGMLAGVGSFGRTVAPILMTWLFSRYGPRWAWGFEIVLLSAAGILVIIFWRRMVPLKTVDTLAAGQHVNYKNGVLYRF